MAFRILFVCLGNICRSPLAEIALREETARRGLDVQIDSAGTGDWHVGDPPDPRSIAVAARHGSDASLLRARQVPPDDFERFDWIIAMDRQNFADLQSLAPANAKAELRLALDVIDQRKGEGVADPYHGDDAAFERTWAEVTAIAMAMVDEIAAQTKG